MISFIKFGIGKYGGIFLASEVLFLIDILIILFYIPNTLTWIGFWLLLIYNVGLIIEWWHGKRRV